MIRDEVRRKLSDAWGVYWGALQDNLGDVLSSFEKIVKSGVDFLDVNDFDDVITTIPAEDGAELADACFLAIVSYRWTCTRFLRGKAICL